MFTAPRQRPLTAHRLLQAGVVLRERIAMGSAGERQPAAPSSARR